MLSTRLAAVHATVSRVFGAQMSKMYKVPVGAVWPPILWSPEFQSDPADWDERALMKRNFWLGKLREQGCKPKKIMLSAGRWSAEKRIHLLIEALPEDCALVIVGDGTSDYAAKIAEAGTSGRKNVLPLRKMLDAIELRIAYAAADLFLSASNFETLGNTIVEAWCSGTPVAVQPAQGHLEFVKDGVNSWFIDYDNRQEATAALSRIAASGLCDNLHTALPEFAAVGPKLRNANFAQDFQKAVLDPALAVGQRYRRGWLLEWIKRCLAFFFCAFLWVFLRVINRVTYVTSKDPSFEVLGRLGSAVDDKRKRPLAEVKENAAAITPVPDCYESHFQPALRKKRSKSMEFFAV